MPTLNHNLPEFVKRTTQIHTASPYLLHTFTLQPDSRQTHTCRVQCQPQSNNSFPRHSSLCSPSSLTPSLVCSLPASTLTLFFQRQLSSTLMQSNHRQRYSPVQLFLAFPPSSLPLSSLVFPLYSRSVLSHRGACSERWLPPSELLYFNCGCQAISFSLTLSHTVEGRTERERRERMGENGRRGRERGGEC